MLLSQNLILLGLFFVIPLYLQVVQGFDAFQTGLRLLPVSVTMLLSAMSGPSLGRFAGPRTVVRIALLVPVAAILWLLGTIDPRIDDRRSASPWPCSAWAWGCSPRSSATSSSPASARANAARSAACSTPPRTSAPSLGTALIGSILISALVTAFTTQIEDNP